MQKLHKYLGWTELKTSPCLDGAHLIFYICLVGCKSVHIALAACLLGLSHHFGAEPNVWGLRGLTQQIAYQVTSSSQIVFFSIWYKGAYDSREPSSCIIVGSSIRYHSMKKCRILHENLNKFPAKAIQRSLGAVLNQCSIIILYNFTIKRWVTKG